MFYRKNKAHTEHHTKINNEDDEDLIYKCIKLQKEILETLKEIKVSLKNMEEGRIKTLEQELTHRNRFTEQLVMAQLQNIKDQPKVSPTVAAYLAKKDGSAVSTTDSVKQAAKKLP